MQKLRTKEEYITAITKILEKIEWLWLLDQIYQFAVNITKTEGDNEK